VFGAGAENGVPGDLYNNTATDIGGALYLFGQSTKVRSTAAIVGVSCLNNQGACVGLEGFEGDGRTLNELLTMGVFFEGNVHRGSDAVDVVIIAAGVSYELNNVPDSEWFIIEATDTP
jgi:hypothetical protein